MPLFKTACWILLFVAPCWSDGGQVRGRSETGGDPNHDQRQALGIKNLPRRRTVTRGFPLPKHGRPFAMKTPISFPTPTLQSVSPAVTPSTISAPTVHPTFKPIIPPTFVPVYAPIATPSATPSIQPVPIRPIHLPPADMPTFQPIYPPTFAPVVTPPGSKPPSPPPACQQVLPPTFAPVNPPTLQPTLSRKLKTASSPTVKPTTTDSLLPTVKPVIVTPTFHPTFPPIEVVPPTFAPVIPPTFRPYYVPPVFNQVFNNTSSVQSSIYLTKFGDSVKGDYTFGFGSQIALSSDGSTMAVTAPLYVVNRTTVGETCLYKIASNSSQWLLSGSVFGGNSGMALSSDGVVLAVAAGGSAKVYRLDSYPWSQTGNTIVGGTSFGSSLALSSNGNVLAVGEPAFNETRGRLTVFHLVRRHWRVVGAPILPTDTEYGNSFGYAVAISADGSIVGTSSPNYGLIGNAMVYQYNVGIGNWLQLGKDISQSPDNAGPLETSYLLGQTLALSANGLRLATNLQSGQFPNTLSDQARVYQYDATIQDWVPFGSKAVFPNSIISHISMSADGNKLAVGLVYEEFRRHERRRRRRLGGLFPYAYVYDIGSGAEANKVDGSIVALSGDGSVLVVSTYDKTQPVLLFSSAVFTYRVTTAR